MKKNKPTISLRRHAHTEKPGVDAKRGEVRTLSEQGKRDTYQLGQTVYHEVFRVVTAPHLRAWETALYLLEGAGKLYAENPERQQKLESFDSLREPLITESYAQRKNVDEHGNKRDRTERFEWYLTHTDPEGVSTTPSQSAAEACHAIVTLEHDLPEKGDSSRQRNRIEAITCAPKLECFLHAFNENAFRDHLEGKTFGHLENIDILPYGNVYVARFRNHEMQIPKSLLVSAAESA